MAGPRELIVKDAGGVLSDLDLLNPSGYFMSEAARGSYDPDQVYLENPAVSDEAILPVSFDVLGATGNATSVLKQDLHRRLRRARQYWTTRWQKAPLYLQVRHAVEDNRRYAILKGVEAIDDGDDWDVLLEVSGILQSVAVNLKREHPWRGEVPGVLPTAKVLTKVNGSADQQENVVTVLGSTGAGDSPTHLYHYDATAGPGWSSNLIGSTNVAILPAAPAVGDRIYIGWDTRPGFHVVLPIGTAMDGAGLTWAVKASRAGALQSLAYGSEYSVYPNPGVSLVAMFETAAEWMFNAKPGSTWEKQASGPAGAITAYWLVLEITALTSVTTVPKLHASETVYGPKRNYVELPAAGTAGDAPPRMMVRAKMPWGDGAAPGIAGLSEIIMGAMANPGSFESVLNLHQYELPSGWAYATGTDAAEGDDVRLPSGRRTGIAFSDTAWASRAQLTGTAKLSAYNRTFHVYLISEQSGGAVADCETKVRAYLGGTGAQNPYVECQPVATRAFDSGYVISDMGEMTFFTDTVYADYVTADIIFQVWARRVTGTSTLRLSRLVFIPISEFTSRAWIDTPLASAHMLGSMMLDQDFGVLFDRTPKYLYLGSGYVPAGKWNRSATIKRIEPATQYRLYFLVGHYASTFGTGPLFANAGSALVVSLFAVNSYLSLRGNA